ncbi:MAG: rRNA maturation RNase YbeY [Opitutus sp.]
MTRPLPSAPAGAHREVSIANQHPRLRIDRKAIQRAIQQLDVKFGRSAVTTSKSTTRTLPVCPPGELSLVFMTDAALAKLHGEYLNDPTSTDVITFEGDPAAATAGEICVSADTAAAYAKEHRRDFSSELTLYLVHGWLHLAGFDDLRPAKKRAMRRAEARAMKLLMGAKCLPTFRLR